MRKLSILLILFVALSSAGLAQKKPYVPDYFPAQLGMEWEYKISTSSGYNMDMRTVVTERPDASKTGYNVVTTSYTPQESKNYYLKKPGWVMALKTEIPASNYTLDYVEDKNEIMNPLKVGATWEYKGKAVASTGEQDWEQSWKVEKVDEVTVPAGKYKAVKVTSVSTVSGNVTNYQMWYVDRVGVVKMITDAGGVTSTTELVKFTVPK